MGLCLILFREQASIEKSISSMQILYGLESFFSFLSCTWEAWSSNSNVSNLFSQAGRYTVTFYLHSIDVTTMVEEPPHMVHLSFCLSLQHKIAFELIFHMTIQLSTLTKTILCHQLEVRALWDLLWNRTRVNLV